MQCVILNCKNVLNVQEKNIQFFEFPTDPEVCKKWVKATGRKIPFKTKDFRVCSAHFTELDISVRDRLMKTPFLERKLQDGAVPRLNLPVEVEQIAAQDSPIICRLCLTEEDVITNLFGHSKAEKTMLGKVERTLHFKVKNTMNFPTMICVMCHSLISDFDKFLQNAKANQMELFSRCRSGNMKNESAMELSEEEIEEDITPLDFEETIPSVTVPIKKTKEIITVKPEKRFSDERKIKEEKMNSNDRNEVVIIDIDEDGQEVDQSDQIMQVLEDEIISLDEERSDKKTFITVEIPSEKIVWQEQIQEIDDPFVEVIEKEQENVDEDDYSKDERKTEKKSVITEAEMDTCIRLADVLKCSVCSLDYFRSFQTLRDHLKDKHQFEEGVSCCDLIYKTKKDLYDHVLSSHLLVGGIQCEFCLHNFSTGAELNAHKLQDHKDDLRLLKCDVCSIQFKNQKIYDRHMKTHYPDSQIQKTCKQCNYKGENWKEIRKHITKAHPEHVNNLHAFKHYPFICEYCGKAYGNKFQMNMHLEKVHFPKKKVECDKCKKYVRSLKFHNCNKGEPLTCTYCGKQYKSQDTLYTHIKYLHKPLNKEELTCKFCGKVLSRPEVLKEHLAIHTGQTLFVCPFCPEEFTMASMKSRHVNSKHHEEWKELKKQREMGLAD